MTTDMNLENAEGWRPEVGETLVGTVTDITRAWSDYKDGWYPIVTIESDKRSSKVEDGTEVAVHCFHTVLFNRMVELMPKIGETIGIKYVAATEKDDKKKGQNKPAIYNVRIEGRSADVWGSMSADPRFTSTPTVTQESAAVEAVTQSDDDIPF